ncbi:hypothetical protein ACA590_16995 [Lactiplantibacillus plantarum]|uniref:hypothetical protein n=1 Tax=Lactiplantibacillus TaxID=2767842 RepID=UPI001C1F3FA4|nr:MULTISPECIES: hypothetical protein [Lactiplantibacillus]MBU7446383.1 hypothetical protein [Lactiplantibacillus plantarum]MBU7459485.1 hypothetical protein [Lactiplantibacillus plantarum]MBU7469117.1 hypothetical protein [Lactiplantibacillus plantarum]MBU7505008.1 hypothetical protein [Lactiplantibacillus pentosus]MDT7023203.1 hypothetical protein [Lactiplantibacillus plantarum]
MKKSLILSATMLTLLLSGCTTNSSSQKESSSKTSTRTVKTSYFQNLSNSAKRNVKFTFKLNQDDTEDNTADPVYVVSATIKNSTNKNIKFDQSKFICVLPSNKIISDKTGTLTIKAGETKSINQLFQKMPEQGTLGDGYIEYLNSDNKLAYTKFTYNIASSNNLTEQKLITQNKDTTANSTNDDMDSSESSSSVENSSSSESSSSQSTTSSTALTESQAKEILRNWAKSRGNGDDNFGGTSLDDLNASEGDNGSWSFVNDDGLSWGVSSTGKIHAPGDPIQ